MTLADPIAALVAELRADPTISTEVGDITIYGQTFPAVLGGLVNDAVASLMPRRLILLGRAGGIATPDDAPIMRPSVDVRCYGGDYFDAEGLMGPVYEYLQRRGRRTSASALILSTTVSTLPIPAVEPDNGWHYQLLPVDVLMQEMVVT